jgi:DNA-binding transcriptional ArsR family regulator
LYDETSSADDGRMPRRTAADRHTDSAPTAAPDQERALEDLLAAFHHPTRRWLHEILAVDGPANVGQLAARTGLAVGSVSHHLKYLHRQGFVEPAPDLARDTRESWWRSLSRDLSWEVDDFEPGTVGRKVAEAAAVENFRHQVRAVQDWLRRQPHEPRAWRRAAGSSDSMSVATAAQLEDLGHRLNDLVRTWVDECRADAEIHPDAERRSVRAVLRTFASGPVHP